MTGDDTARLSKTGDRLNLPLLLDVAEVAVHLAISKRQVWRLIERQELEDLYQGTRRVVTSESLLAYYDRRLQAAREARAAKQAVAA